MRNMLTVLGGAIVYALLGYGAMILPLLARLGGW
jgi:hypothetical protein